MQKNYNSTDLLVFSHLRWDFVFQRPQHLMTRFAKHRRVFYFEEPIFGMTEFPRLHIRSSENVNIVVPHLPVTLAPQFIEESLVELVDELIFSEELNDYSLWYYTPMALPFTRHLNPKNILFDCMDELSLFRGAPQSLLDLETELLQCADLVFTGGETLFQAKKSRHQNIHPFPSSIDFEHFSQARSITTEPADQAKIPHPRIGFYGVIDERMNVDLLIQMAELKPDFHFVIIGPIAKINPETLTKKNNIHYLDKKEYNELPHYLAGWDCAMMPFALNDSTKFISPTKTPEYLAAGKPVVSTSITDVIHPYKDQCLVHIADDAETFITAITNAMEEKKLDPYWLTKVDDFLSGNSWDKTFMRMAELEQVTKPKTTETKNNYMPINDKFTYTQAF